MADCPKKGNIFVKMTLRISSIREKIKYGSKKICL